MGRIRSPTLNQAARAAAKAESREADRARLESGQVTRAALSAENDWFRGIDVRSFEIEAVGAVRISGREAVAGESAAGDELSKSSQNAAEPGRGSDT